MSRSDEFADVASFDKYHLSADEEPRHIIARATTKDGQPGKRIGFLSWYGGKPEYTGRNVDGGVIAHAYVSQQFRRKGIASAMLDFARAKHPDSDIRHSSALSDDGKAWSEGHK